MYLLLLHVYLGVKLMSYRQNPVIGTSYKMIIHQGNENLTNTVYLHIYMEFRKIVMITLYVRQQKRHRCKEQTFGLCGRK